MLPMNPFMNKRALAIMAAVGESTIYGLNHTIAKGVMPEYIKPFGFIFLRVAGATMLFWLISLWFPKEKVAKSDWPRLLASAFFGMVLNMLFFFKGLSLSTPINSSVIVTITPILVLLLSSYLLREKITWLKVSGIILGLSGALMLVLFSAETGKDAPNIPLGNLMFIVNAVSFGIYLILVKPLTSKYHPVTLMKWIFLTAFIINFPITFSDFTEVEWQVLPQEAVWSIVFVVLGTTFLTYLLNRSEEHTSELQSRENLVCRLLLRRPPRSSLFPYTTLFRSKPLTSKYHPVTLMKWIFLTAFIINFPITFSDFTEVEWQVLPQEAVWSIVFVVLGTTFLTYLLN